MKKKLSALCAAVLTLGLAVAPAQAAQQHYPLSVEEYREGDEPRIRKVYQLSLSESPEEIPVGDFERNGRLYSLLDMTRRDDVGVDTKEHTDTITLDSDTGELSVILKRLEGQREVVTEDGYSGTLLLDHTSVSVEVKGYKTSSRTHSATRSYPNLSDADVALVPKTIEEGGRTLTLADVQWSSAYQENGSQHYTATASYTGTSSSRYATGYTVTASYTGQVAKTGCEVVTYTAVFGSTPLPVEEPENPEAAEPADQDTAAPEEDGKGASGTVILSLLGCVGGVYALGMGALWLIRRRKGADSL